MAMKKMYAKAHTLTLPSGVKFRVRRPSILTLINSGGFPSEMTIEIWKVVSAEGLDPKKLLEDAKGLTNWAKLIDMFIPHVSIMPKITTDGAETNIAEDANGIAVGNVDLATLPDADKQLLFLFGTYAAASDEEMAEGATAPVPALTRFPEGAAREDDRSGSAEVRTETEQPSGVAAG